MLALYCTVKPVLSSHLKLDKTKVLIENQFMVLFLSGGLKQVLLYILLLAKYVVALGFNSFLASNNFRHLLIMFANSLDPDQDGQIFGPDLDPNHLLL